MLVAPCAIERRRGLAEAGDGLTIVALIQAGDADVLVRQRPQGIILSARREREGALSGGDGLAIRRHNIAFSRQPERDPSQPTRVIEGYRQGLAFTQIR